MITPIRSFYLPSGRVVLSKTEDDYLIESTEMRDVTLDGKKHCEVRESMDPHVIWKHLVDIKHKWLLTVSTQKGCVHNCKFCDVANLPFKGNLTATEIFDQIVLLVSTTPELQNLGTDKAKIGFARMGEPAHNLDNVIDVIKHLFFKSTNDKLNNYYNELYSPIFDQIIHNINWLPCFNSIIPVKTMGDYSGEDVVNKVLDLKENICDGVLHFQISCNSTDENVRKQLFGGADVLPLEKIINIVNNYPEIKKRTITFNFIVMENVPIDVDYLMRLGLNPDRFAVKLIPLNDTMNAQENKLETRFNYSSYDELRKYADKFKKEGIPVVYDAIAKCEESRFMLWPTCPNISIT